MSFVRLGVDVWGAATAIMAFLCLGFVLIAAQWIDDANGVGDRAPRYMKGLYFSLKDNNTLVAAILAAGGLAWSYFFNAYVAK
jgi:hypothetical protein